jgi:hypothetical protein
VPTVQKSWPPQSPGPIKACLDLSRDSFIFYVLSRFCLRSQPLKSYILNQSLYGGEWSVSRPCRFTRGKELQVPIQWKYRLAPKQVWKCRASYYSTVHSGNRKPDRTARSMYNSVGVLNIHSYNSCQIVTIKLNFYVIKLDNRRKMYTELFFCNAFRSCLQYINSCLFLDYTL